MTTVNIDNDYRIVVVNDSNGDTAIVTAPSPAVIVETTGLGPQGPGGTLAAYASAIDTTDQPIVSTTSAQALTYSTLLESRAVTITNNSRINFTIAGTYKILASIQLTNASNNTSEINVFLKKNGATVTNSNTRIDLEQRKSVNVPYHGCFTIEFQLTVAASDYTQIFWSADQLGVTVDTIPADAIHPQAPSVILNVAQVMYYQTSIPNGVNNGDTLVWSAATNQWLASNALTLLEQRVTALESV